ncbi:MAG: hypothetical protein AAGK10_15165 [Cyanobacteria bacterium J06555_3]
MIKKILIVYTVPALIFVILVVYLVNAFYKPSAIEEYQWSSIQENPKDELEIVTWNLGYAGLGRGSNFVMDGGTDWRPKSRKIVEQNVSGIIDFLKSTEPDLFLFQEIAKPSFLNHHVDVLNSVITALPKYPHIYISDFRTHLIPYPYNINSGLSVFAKSGLVSSSKSRLLPLEPRRFGAFRKHYQMVVNHVPTSVLGKEWIIINLHLAAFDSDANIRSEQLKVIRSFAIEQYRQGNFVIIGGDWNLRLAETNFPHKTEKKYLFWVNDLPDDAFPSDWRIVADSDVPSVRTVHKAYVPDDNYVTIIDGFVTSPNVKSIYVKTTALGFVNSDHNPIKAKFAAQ